MQISNIHGKQTFRGIQALRGLAACFVVAYHCTEMWSLHTNQLNHVWVNGRFGVDIFFVISGFVMVIATSGRTAKAHPGWDFLKRRLVRIVPLYWFVSLLFLAKDLMVQWHPALQNATPHGLITWKFTVLSLLFIPFYDGVGALQPLVPVGWTLSFEMFFYLLFAAALALRVKPLRWVGGLFVLLAAVSPWVPKHGPAIERLVSPLLLEFVVGMLLARWTMSGKRLPTALSCFTGTAALLWLLIAPSQRMEAYGSLTYAIAAILLVVCTTSLEPQLHRLLPRLALRIGDASYSIYLIHLLVFSFLLHLAARLHLLDVKHASAREAATVALYLFVSIVVGMLLDKLEAPFNRWLRHRLNLRDPTTQSQTS